MLLYTPVTIMMTVMVIRMMKDVILMLLYTNDIVPFHLLIIIIFIYQFILPLLFQLLTYLGGRRWKKSSKYLGNKFIPLTDRQTGPRHDWQGLAKRGQDSLSSSSSVFLFLRRSSLSISLLHFVVSSRSCVALGGVPQGLCYVLLVFSCLAPSELFFVLTFERCCFCCSNSSSSSCSYFVLVVHVERLSWGRHGCDWSLLVSVCFSCHLLYFFAITSTF